MQSTPVSGAAKTRYYSTSTHGDTEALTDPDDGDVTAAYRYTAYGAPDVNDNQGEDTVAQKDDTSNPADPTKDALNPYRYSSKRIDSATGDYDMGFRTYSPGLNRFLTRDMYNGALSDLKLGMDPWNTNRYAFAGGNPITRIEYDGHKTVDISGGDATTSLEDMYNGDLGGGPMDPTLGGLVDPSAPQAEEQSGRGGGWVPSWGEVGDALNPVPELARGTKNMFLGTAAGLYAHSGNAQASGASDDISRYGAEKYNAGMAEAGPELAWLTLSLYAPETSVFRALISRISIRIAERLATGRVASSGLARSGALRDAALEVHDLATPAIRHNMWTVALAEVRMPGEGSEFFAAGSGGRLSAAQVARLEELGVPTGNILRGPAHAEMNIINGLPKGAQPIRWGIAWAGGNKPIPCPRCHWFVNGIIEGAG